MTWKKVLSTHDGIGTIVDVRLNEKEMLIERTFKEGSITASGQQHHFNADQVKQFYENEIYWLDKLSSKWVPETVSVDTKKQTIVQKYYGPCLLDYLHTDLHERIPDLKEQIIEMYAFFKQHNIFKRNGSLSNLTYNNGQVIAFDFKWTKQRPDGLEMELHSYKNWLNKIDKTLEHDLEAML